MSLPALSLSLQFGSMPDAAAHRLVLTRSNVSLWIRQSLKSNAEITVRVVDQHEARALNREYRRKDYATNVLTFKYQQHPMVMADLVLCAEVVEKEARQQGKTLKAHYAHLLIHGSLHAQGYDHETGEDDATEMESLEILLLGGLGFANPYGEG